MNINQKVKVVRLDDDSATTIKYGVITALTSHFARVFQEYNPKTNEGDPLMYAAEWFPINSRRMKIIPVG